MKKITIITYGCTTNQDNSAIIAGLLDEAGYKITDNLKSTSIIIINSCIVKSPTESRVISKIKELKSKYPRKKLILAGCMPEAEYKLCKKVAPSSPLLSPHHVTDIVKVVKDLEKGKITELIGKRKEIKLCLPKIKKDKKIAIVQIAEGCSSQCSFCITKFAKGHILSYPENLILKEIEKNIKQGCKKIYLTAQDTAAYGLDKHKKSQLPKLLNKITKIKGNFIVRVGMMNPRNALPILDELIESYKSKKIFEFLHLPLQSASNKVLKDMNRNYTLEQFKKIVKKFRKNIPNLNLSTDIICGFPTETEKDFKETINFIKKIKPEVLNISKFGPRPGTQASKMKQLTSQEIKRRSVLLTKTFKGLSRM